MMKKPTTIQRLVLELGKFAIQHAPERIKVAAGLALKKVELRGYDRGFDQAMRAVNRALRQEQSANNGTLTPDQTFTVLNGLRAAFDLQSFQPNMWPSNTAEAPELDFDIVAGPMLAKVTDDNVECGVEGCTWKVDLPNANPTAKAKAFVQHAITEHAADLHEHGQ